MGGLRSGALRAGRELEDSEVVPTSTVVLRYALPEV